MGNRKRINPLAVCSSNNYRTSKRVHTEYLKATHEDRMKVINNIVFNNYSEPVAKEIHIGRPYIVIFGKKKYLTKEGIEVCKRANTLIPHHISLTKFISS